MKKSLLFTLLCVFSMVAANAQVELLSNGSFETGDLTDWTIDSVNGFDNGPTSCEENWRVQEDSLDICGFGALDVTPTDGTFGAFTSFDSDIADTEWILEQTVTLPTGSLVEASISFDFAAEFDFSLGAPITIDRQLIVELFDMSGTSIVEVSSDGFADAGAISVSLSQDVDVLAALTGLEGQDVALRITALIPEIQTGPSKAVIDNISFMVMDVLGTNDERLDSQLTVFPNPSNGDFTINYEGAEALTAAKIFDINGRLVRTLSVSEIGNSTITTDLLSGLYILEINTENGIATRKLVVR